MTSERRYSITPLVEAMHLAPGACMARALNVSGTRLASFVEFGIDEKTADRLAARSGFVAWQVWPEMLDEAIDDLTVECEADGCPTTFVPPALKWGQKRRRYCSRNCQLRHNKRLRYQSRPEVAERQREAVRRYKAEVRAARARREGRAA